MKETIALMLGLVTPLLISWLKQKSWRRETKLLLAFAVCCAVAAVQVIGDAVLTGTFDVSSMPTLIAYVFSAAILSYQLHWERTDLNARLEATAVLP